MSQAQIGVLELLTGLGVGGVITKVVDAIMRGRTPRKDYLEAVAQAADLLMDGMRKDFDALREELRTEKRDRAEEVAALKRDHAEREAACDRRLDEMAGQLRAARQEVASLLAQLRDPRATEPGGPLEGAVIELKDGGAAVVSTKQTRRPR